jgi:indole-3-acetate monooxygenase
VFDARAAAAAIAPRIAARAEEIETARRLPTDLAREMAQAQLFRLVVPAVYGGPQCCVAEAIQAIEIIAQADASAGWCTMIAATTALNAAYLPPDLAREIYADPLGITGGVFAPLGKGVREGDDLIVSGRWAWASGSQNCSWLLGGCVVIEDGLMRTLPSGAPDHRMVFFPAAEAELIDTWHVTGLKGTGSLDMQVHQLRVPYRRSVSLIVDKPQVDGVLYAFPAFGLLALGIAGVALGNARAALDGVKTQLASKRQVGAKRTMAERGAVQMQFAQAEAQWGSARAFLYESIALAWRQAEQGDAITTEGRAQLRLAATHATRTCADVVRSAYDLAGGAGVYLSNDVQRRFRDGHVLPQHIMVQSATYELVGRALLGVGLDDSTL